LTETRRSHLVSEVRGPGYLVLGGEAIVAWRNGGKL